MDHPVHRVGLVIGMRDNPKGMQRAFLVAIAASIAGCQVVYPMPRAPNPDTGEYECPIGRPAGVTLLVAAAAAGAVAAFKAGSPQTCGPSQFWDGNACAPQYDMHGYPNCGFLFQPDCNASSSDIRSARWPLVALGSLAAVAAIASWSEYDRCTRLDQLESRGAAARRLELGERHDVNPVLERQRELASLARTASARADAGDCDAVRSIAVRVRALDPVYYATLFVPLVAACVSP